MNLVEEPKFISVGNRQLQLIATSLDGLTEAQSETYQLLLLLCQLNVIQANPKAISDYLQLKSPAPLWSRLEHLREAGKVRYLEQQVA